MVLDESVRLDYRIICSIVEPESKLLDLGCGEGKLLHFLYREKKTKGQGIELSEEAIYKCVENGVSVFHGDIEQGLTDYPDNTFDYIILNQSMQEIKKVDYVIEEALRVAKKVIVGFPNFAHYKARLRLVIKGQSPVTTALPYRWYDTPNVHFLSILDFKEFCEVKGIKILDTYYLGKKREIGFMPNLFAVNAIFVISR